MKQDDFTSAKTLYDNTEYLYQAFSITEKRKNEIYNHFQKTVYAYVNDFINNGNDINQAQLIEDCGKICQNSNELALISVNVGRFLSKFFEI